MIRDRGIDPELLEEVTSVLEYLSSRGYRTFTVERVMWELREMESNGMLDGHRSESEVRRALQALVMDEKNMPNTTFGSEMPYQHVFGSYPIDRIVSPSALPSEERKLQIPNYLDSNLTLGLGQN